MLARQHQKTLVCLFAIAAGLQFFCSQFHPLASAQEVDPPEVVVEQDEVSPVESDQFFEPFYDCDACPLGYGFAEGLVLDRNNRAANRPLVLDLNSNGVLLSTSDLDFRVGGGVRALLGRRIDDRRAIELGYLGVFDLSRRRTVLREDSLTVPPPLGLVVNNFFAADRMDVGYDSGLHSGELNLVHCRIDDECCRSLECLAGFRYLYLEEDIALTSFDSAEGTSTYAVQTENHLFGGQLGLRWRDIREFGSCEISGKAGVYGNAASQSQAPIVDFPNFVFRTGRSSSAGEVAFVGEVNFTAVRELNELWNLRLGYNLIWVDGVALAADQFDFSNTPTSGTALFTQGAVFLHGANLGLEARW